MPEHAREHAGVSRQGRVCRSEHAGVNMQKREKRKTKSPMGSRARPQRKGKERDQGAQQGEDGVGRMTQGG